MAKYSGLNSEVEGVTTANQDLYALAKANEGWLKYTPWTKVSFIPTSNCTIKINSGTGEIVAPAEIGWSDDNTQITSFEVVESGVVYILSYRY